MSLKKTAIDGSKWTAVGTVGKALMQVLQVVVLTRFLAKADFGVFALSLFIVNFFQILSDFGFNSSLMHQQKISKQQFSSLYSLNLIVATALFVILLTLVPFVANFYSNKELILLIPIHASILFLNSIGKYHRLMLHKSFQFKVLNQVELLSFFLGLVAAIIAAVVGLGVYSLVIAALLTAFIANISFYILNYKEFRFAFRLQISEVKPFLRVGGFHMGSSILDFLSKEIDVMIIGKLLGNDLLGVYSLIKQIVIKVFSMINPIMMNVIIPIFSSIQSDIVRLNKIYKKLVNYASLVNLPVYALLIFCAAELLEILYGKDYHAYGLVLSFMAFTYFIISIFNSVGSLQIATGRTDLGFKWTIIRFLATPLVIYFAAQISLVAVAASYSMLFVLFVIPIWKIQLQPMIGIGLVELIRKFIQPFLAILIVLIVSFYFNEWQISNNVFLNLFVKAIFVGLYVFLFGFLFERKLGKEVIKKGSEILLTKFRKF